MTKKHTGFMTKAAPYVLIAAILMLWELASASGVMPGYMLPSPGEVVNAFVSENGVAVPYRIAGRRAGDIATCYADPEKAARVFGWRATHTLADMVRDSWRWQSQNPNGYDE